MVYMCVFRARNTGCPADQFKKKAARILAITPRDLPNELVLYDIIVEK